jgi:glutamyl-Q tRNA(Asp) synthetase
VRIEDLDTPRVVPGSADEILETLRRYGLRWDGEVESQSRRTHLYDAALARLRERGLVYECGCSRADIQRAASAPLGSEPVYPGTCRNGLPAGRVARAIRFRAPNAVISFDDAIAGCIEENVARTTGDFVIKRLPSPAASPHPLPQAGEGSQIEIPRPAERGEGGPQGRVRGVADGTYAYQLAVIVDDAEQGVTQVVRGADLLASTPRQIALQRALDLPTPAYAHLPLVVAADGSKLGKRDGALPLSTLDVPATLSAALRILGIEATSLQDALDHFDPKRVPRNSVTARLNASG